MGLRSTVAALFTSLTTACASVPDKLPKSPPAPSNPCVPSRDGQQQQPNARDCHVIVEPHNRPR